MSIIERESLPSFRKLKDKKERLKTESHKVIQQELILNGSYNLANWLFNLGFRVKHYVDYKSTLYYSGKVKIVSLKNTDADKMMRSYLLSTFSKPKVFRRSSDVLKSHPCCSYQIEPFGKLDEDILRDIYILLGIQSKSVNQDEILKLLDEMTSTEGNF